MRDCLLDLVGHTLDLGCIDLIKIVGTADKTSVVGLATDLSVVLDARFHDQWQSLWARLVCQTWPS